MDMDELNKYVIKEDCTLKEALRQLDICQQGILFVIDAKKRLTGCVTDGDIRRWLIKTGNLNGVVSAMMNRHPKYVFEGNEDEGYTQLKNHRVLSFPVLDSGRRIVGIRFGNKDHMVYDDQNKTLQNTPVIVMAGGKGTRLAPFTNILPKPLIPVGDIPILERILNRFYRYGVKNFYLTVNYRKEMIRSYFSEGSRPYSIHYIEEDEPMGTAGSIRLIDESFKIPVMVTNCDVLIEADYNNLMMHHKASGNDMTIVASLKNTAIPYGVLHTEAEGLVSSMEEKPSLSYFINTGMYVVNPEYLGWIPKGRMFHMTQLADKMIDAGKRVGMYPVSEDSFLDMGEFEELKKMEDRIHAGINDE